MGELQRSIAVTVYILDFKLKLLFQAEYSSYGERGLFNMYG
jgi:hypothetical protein